MLRLFYNLILLSYGALYVADCFWPQHRDLCFHALPIKGLLGECCRSGAGLIEASSLELRVGRGRSTREDLAVGILYGASVSVAGFMGLIALKYLALLDALSGHRV
jgi:hypothetical protein